MANKQDGTVEKVKENVVDVLKGFARYAHASYCEEKLLNWTCDPCVEGFTEQASFVKVFLNKTTEGRAYMAVDYLRKSVVIGFRGTVSAQNWYYDLKTDFVNATEALEWPLAAKDTGRIHRGFTETYLSIKHQIMPLLLRVRAALPSFNIITVGHSMGAALAALAAVDFHYTLISPPKILSFTYGQPRIGDLEFSNSVNKLHDSQDVMIYRMINNNDLIPHLPPTLFDYVHTNTEYWINKNTTWACTAKEGEMDECSATYAPFFDSNRHVYMYDMVFYMC